jgi:hypothetical protein
MRRPAGDQRGQVVLVAAAVVAVALVAMLLAAAQLGARPASPAPADAAPADLERVERPLARAVSRGASDAAGRFPWRRRAAAAGVVEAHLRPAVAAVEGGGVAADVTYRVERNETAAAAAARAACPRGEDRAYGDCAARGAFVFQSRAGEAHLVGVALDVRIDAADRTTRATLLVRPGAPA